MASFLQKMGVTMTSFQLHTEAPAIQASQIGGEESAVSQNPKSMKIDNARAFGLHAVV